MQDAVGSMQRLALVVGQHGPPLPPQVWHVYVLVVAFRVQAVPAALHVPELPLEPQQASPTPPHLMQRYVPAV
jgi:hypothetical protein